jgi:hypothetical protein
LSLCGKFVALPKELCGKEIFTCKVPRYETFGFPDHDDFRELDVKFIVFPQISKL